MDYPNSCYLSCFSPLVQRPYVVWDTDYKLPGSFSSFLNPVAAFGTKTLLSVMVFNPQMDKLCFQIFFSCVVSYFPVTPWSSGAFYLLFLQVVILDVRVPCTPVARLNNHRACVNGIAWAPHSSCHICTAGNHGGRGWGGAMGRERSGDLLLVAVEV